MVQKIIKLNVSVLFLLLSVTLGAQININTNFDVRTPQPIDTRDTLTFTKDTALYTYIFPGIWTFNRETNTYWHTDSTLHWREFKAGIDSVYTNLVGDSTFIAAGGVSYYIPIQLMSDTNNFEAGFGMNVVIDTVVTYSVDTSQIATQYDLAQSIDSTRLTQDSILVYYQNNIEIGRDTIKKIGGVVDNVYSIAAVPDTSMLTPSTGDAFINSGKDTLGLYDGGQWRLFFGGDGDGIYGGSGALPGNVNVDMGYKKLSFIKSGTFTTTGASSFTLEDQTTFGDDIGIVMKRGLDSISVGLGLGNPFIKYTSPLPVGLTIIGPGNILIGTDIANATPLPDSRPILENSFWQFNTNGTGQYKRLVAGSNVTITSAGDSIQITASGGGNVSYSDSLTVFVTPSQLSDSLATVPLQTLSANLGVKEISISGGNTISIDDWFLDAVTTDATLTGDGSLVTPLGIDTSKIATQYDLSQSVDSTRLTQDSILVYYTGGVEVGRDTVRTAATGGGGDISYSDSLTVFVTPTQLSDTLDSRLDTLPSGQGTINHLAIFLEQKRIESISELKIDQTNKLLQLPDGWAILGAGGTTASRWTGSAGALYYNQDIGQYEFHNGTTWASMSPFTIEPDGDLLYTGGDLGINVSPLYLLDISGFATQTSNLFRIQGVQAAASFYVTASGDQLNFNFPSKTNFLNSGYFSYPSGNFRWGNNMRMSTSNGKEVFSLEEYAENGGPRWGGINFGNDAYETTILNGHNTFKGRQYVSPFVLNLPAATTHSSSPVIFDNDIVAAMTIKSDIMGFLGVPTINLAGILLNPEFLSTDANGNTDTVNNVYGIFYEPIALPSNRGEHYSYFATSGRIKAANYEFDNEQTLTGHDGDALRYDESTGRISLSATAHCALKKISTTSLTLGVNSLRINGMSSGPVMNATYTDSTIIISVDGIYEIQYSGSVTLEPSTGGTYRITFSLYNNSTQYAETIAEYEIVATGAGIWYNPIAGHTIAELEAGDIISLRYNGTAGTTSELKNISLSLRKL